MATSPLPPLVDGTNFRFTEGGDTWEVISSREIPVSSFAGEGDSKLVYVKIKNLKTGKVSEKSRGDLAHIRFCGGVVTKTIDTPGVVTREHAERMAENHRQRHPQLYETFARHLPQPRSFDPPIIIGPYVDRDYAAIKALLPEPTLGVVLVELPPQPQRCPACGHTLYDDIEKGCVPGSCSWTEDDGEIKWPQPK